MLETDSDLPLGLGESAEHHVGDAGVHERVDDGPWGSARAPQQPSSVVGDLKQLTGSRPKEDQHGLELVAPVHIRDAIQGRAQHERSLLHLPTPEVQEIPSRQSHLRYVAVRLGQAGGVAQHAVGLFDALLCRQGSAHQQRRRQPATAHRSAGEPLGESGIESAKCHGGAVEEQRSLDRTSTIEPPQRETQDVVAAAQPDAFEPVGEGAALSSRAGPPHRGGHDLAIERMCQHRDGTIAALLDGDNPSVLESLEPDDIGCRLEQGELDRPSDREHLHDGRLRVVQAAESPLDQLGESARWNRRARGPPDGAVAGQITGFDTAKDELPQVQRVAARPTQQVAERNRIDGAAEDRLGQVGRPGSIERSQVDSLREAVLPEPREDGRYGSSRSDRHHHGGDAVADRQVDERGRMRIEQMRVVDRQDDRPGVVGSRPELVEKKGHQPWLIDAAGRDRQQLRECRERDHRRRTRCRDPRYMPSTRALPPMELCGKACLTHASVAEDLDAGCGTLAHRRRQPLDQRFATDKRPLEHHTSRLPAYDRTVAAGASIQRADALWGLSSRILMTERTPCPQHGPYEPPTGTGPARRARNHAGGRTWTVASGPRRSRRAGPRRLRW